MKTFVRHYIELALRESLARKCPGYGKSAIETVVSASMKGLHVSKEILYRAIEMAAATRPKDLIK